MSTDEKNNLRNRLWRRFSKSAPARIARRLAANFRDIFAELFCTSVAIEPQSRSSSQTSTASTAEAPLAATLEYMPVHDDQRSKPSVHVDIAVPEERGRGPMIVPATSRHVAVVVPVTEGASKPRRPLYRPTPLLASDVGSTTEKRTFGAAINDSRVVFVDRRYPNDHPCCKATRIVPESDATVDTDNTTDINVDAVINELDVIINSRPNTGAETSEVTEDIDVDEVISELDDIINGVEIGAKSRGDVGELTVKLTHTEETTAADIDDIIDEEFNYYGI